MLKKRDDYYPFGLSIKALSSSAPLSKPNNFKLSGNELQADFDLGWVDFNARMFDPVLGRFAQIDPLATTQESWNPYHYSYNNPLLFVDPSGLEPSYNWDTGQYEDGDGNVIGWQEAFAAHGIGGSSQNTSCPDGNCDEDKTDPQEPLIKGPLRQPINLPGVPVTKNNLELAQAEAAYETSVTLFYLLAIFDALADSDFSGTNSKAEVLEDGTILLKARMPLASLAKLPKLLRNVKKIPALQAQLKKIDKARVVVVGEDMANRVIPFANKYGFKYFKPRGKNPEFWMRNQTQWIRRQLKDANTVIFDIGPKGAAPVSKYYKKELEMLVKYLKDL